MTCPTGVEEEVEDTGSSSEEETGVSTVDEEVAVGELEDDPPLEEVEDVKADVEDVTDSEDWSTSFFAQPVAIRVEQVNKKIRPKRVFFIKDAKLPPWKQFNLHVSRMKDEKGKKVP